MPAETDRERLERIKRETAYAAGPTDGVYVTRRGKPLEITVKMADLDWLIAVAERTLVSRPAALDKAQAAQPEGERTR